jgi:hypothetical protein
MTVRGVLPLLLAGALFASPPRFTDEMWLPIEPLFQKMAALRHGPPAAVRRALLALAAKASRPEWRELLERDAADLPAVGPSDRYTDFLSDATKTKPFAEGLAAVLAEFWIEHDLNPERGTVEPLGQLTRMMNSEAARLDDAGRARVKEAFMQAARHKLAHMQE